MKYKYTCVVTTLDTPMIIVHGGAGAYLKTTTHADRIQRGQRLQSIALGALKYLGDPRAATLWAIAEMERDPNFNAGYGSKLQRDGIVRVSAALMQGKNMHMSSVFNVQSCMHPSQLADVLQSRGDRNLDGFGAALLMDELQVKSENLITERTKARWQSLIERGDTVDPEAAIGNSGNPELELAREANLPVPKDLSPLQSNEKIPTTDNRYGTVGVVGVGADGDIWACTSTGGRGHEYPGRISDTGMPAGNYACPQVGISATGFGEQIIDLNVCGRIATRVMDGASLEKALRKTFDEVVAYGGLLGVIAATADGQVGYAHTTEACGVAWADTNGATHVDRHGAEH